LIQASTSRSAPASAAARPHPLSTPPARHASKRVSLRAVRGARCVHAAAAASNATDYANIMVTEVMVSNPLSIPPSTTVEECIELLVQKGISGVPVTDEDGKLLGEVSGFDIIALDKTPGRVDTTDGMFPKIGRCEEYNGDVGKMWGNFLELQQIAAQANSSTVGQIMSNALSIPQSTTLEDAACLVVEKKVYRMSVLDDDGKLVGVLSRGDIMRVALKMLKSLKA